MNDNQESERRRALIGVILRSIQEDPILYGLFRGTADNLIEEAAGEGAASGDATGNRCFALLALGQRGARNTLSAQLKAYFETKIQTKESAIKLSRVNWDVIADWILAESGRGGQHFSSSYPSPKGSVLHSGSRRPRATIAMGVKGILRVWSHFLAVIPRLAPMLSQFSHHSLRLNENGSHRPFCGTSYFPKGR